MEQISPIIYFLVIIFGASSWLSVNGIWLQLPLLVNDLPEGWNLPSYITAVVQLACIAPLIFGILQRKFKEKLPIIPIILGLLAFGTTTQLLMAFFYDKTSEIDGQKHSTALIILFFCISLMATTSDVAFLPIFSRFPAPYVTAYFIGMGCSGLLPSLLAIVQGVNRIECVPQINLTTNETTYDSQTIPPRFSVTIFFAILSILMFISSASFCLLMFLQSEKQNGDVQSKFENVVP